jgi:hypothetical protein
MAAVMATKMAGCLVSSSASMKVLKTALEKNVTPVSEQPDINKDVKDGTKDDVPLGVRRLGIGEQGPEDGFKDGCRDGIRNGALLGGKLSIGKGAGDGIKAGLLLGVKLGVDEGSH